MKISILVPVYGVESHIARCVRSLFGQTFDDIEYVFVDDCSPDRSMQILEEILAEYPDRRDSVKIVRHSRNRGLACARNTAVAHAAGDYFLHVDSDDYLDTKAVELLHDRAVAERADMVVFDFRWHTSHGEVTKAYSIAEDRTEHVGRLLCRDPRCSWSVCNRLCSKRLYESVRWIDGLNMGEDYATTPRLVYFSRRIVKLDAPLYNQSFDHAGSYTHDKLTEKSVQDMVRAVEFLCDFFGGIPDADRYARYMDRMKFKNRIYLLLSSPPELRGRAIHCFSGTDVRRAGASPVEKILYGLARRGMWRTFDSFVDAGKRIRRYFRF